MNFPDGLNNIMIQWPEEFVNLIDLLVMLFDIGATMKMLRELKHHRAQN